MKKRGISNEGTATGERRTGEKGSAIVIALFVLALISVFVALAMSRSSAEAAATGNETAEGRTNYAAQASLEMMTRNFNKKFEVNLKPTSVSFDDVRTAPVPGHSTSLGGQYTFVQEVLQTSNSDPTVLVGGPFGGLLAKRDNWRLRTTATNNQGVQVQLTRNVLNNLVPIFQFGIFYDDDLEFHPGPRFDFGGRVHSNGNLFLQANDGVYFSSKVTTANHIFTDVSKNGSSWTNWDDEVFIRNASNNYVQLQSGMGSVLTAPVNGAAVTSNPPPTIPLPTAYTSTTWAANQAQFDGNLLANTPLLQLPLKLNSDNTNQNLALNEVIKRGKQVGDLWNNGTGTPAAPAIVAVTGATADDAITAAERYYNKTGIRISLADSRQRLPGCSATTDATNPKCGVRLDGDSVGQTSGLIAGIPRGYQPVAMVGATYPTTRVNGDRLYSANAKETWIKIETVIYNPTTEAYDTSDITQDILALGVTEPLQPVLPSLTVTEPNYGGAFGTANGADTRSIVKLQRFLMPGADIPNTTGAIPTATFMSYFAGQNLVVAGSLLDGTGTCSAGGNYTVVDGGDHMIGANGFLGDQRSVGKKVGMDLNADGDATDANERRCVVPFPINMFDTREGLYNDSTATFDPTAVLNYGANVPWAGVMSMVDIDVTNLKRFLDGSFDANMPTGTPYHTATGHVLRGNDIPQPTNVAPKAGGWVLYVSDRRGDRDFDGDYDMEDVFGNNDGITQAGEDVNRSGTLQSDVSLIMGWVPGEDREATRYTGLGRHISPDIAATFEHRYFRRGVRVINGQTLPGFYDTATPVNTRGFTVASENGVYVKGNYNATGIASVGTPTPSTDYLPASTSSLDIPASVASDAVTILSNAWQDANSFTSPFSHGSRDATETHMRFAMLSGDSITSLNGTPNQGGDDPRMNGGVHNFKRFLENWGGTRLNYSGSLINLFNSRNNNGTYKCCVHVYSPPARNWVFDATFLDINRLPPGTPYFQYVQTTGFQRTND